ncbi:MAG TPA: hypothetical protein VGK19_08165 [Capsulimonadaceae bacterium]|jgi:hypothetical protein
MSSDKKATGPWHPTDNMPPDPFDSRPAIVIRPTEAERTTWGLLAALGITAAMGAVAFLIAGVSAHQQMQVVASAIASAVFVALTIHGFRNPPATIGLNVSTRTYQVIKGSGQFRKSFKGSFDEIVGVSVKVEESSHGISGYTVSLTFASAAGTCIIERHGVGAETIATDRAAKLARILGVAVMPHTSKPTR